ncbi:ferritin [Tepiditoga spiralis]|uniref:ferritin n=1 Tax=Tepiditoga spiralis TaxID=2108365 RepID=UPI0022B7D585|nr:ferritin [Tepiditoga spiralis]
MNKEFYSAYLYLAMASYFEEQNLPGFANWMRIQFQEEAHAFKFFDYLVERGGHVELEKIEKPKTTWENPIDAFNDVYAHEQFISKSINEIFKVAREENDYPTETFIHWFIMEQVEEEKNAKEILDRLSMIKDNIQPLFMLDSELAKRVFTPLV